MVPEAPLARMKASTHLVYPIAARGGGARGEWPLLPPGGAMVDIWSRGLQDNAAMQLDFRIFGEALDDVAACAKRPCGRRRGLYNASVKGSEMEFDLADVHESSI